MNSHTIKLLISIVPATMLLSLGSCKKFLTEKPDQQLSIITTVQDLQSLLDDHSRLNTTSPAAAEISADDYYVTNDIFNAIGETDRNMYTWAEGNLFTPGATNDWAFCYNNIYKANVVLDNLTRLERTAEEQPAWNTVKGHALLIRANSFLQAAIIWTPAYDPATAQNDAGLPLRLDPDFSKPSIRSSVEETYKQIITDCKAAIGLLPVTPIHVVRPSRGAALAILARAYLAMREYDSAGHYVRLCLADKGELLNYNSIDLNAAFPFAPRFSNPEIIWDLAMIGPPDILYPDYCNIDTGLYRAYHDDDLRRAAFFYSKPDGTISFNGSYEGNLPLFVGPAVDEMILIKAECTARSGDVHQAMQDLNLLLQHRYKSGGFIPLQTADKNEAINYILAERRKELLMRGLRWMDLKRLNREGRSIIIKRFVNNKEFNLTPNSIRYSLPIPDDVILQSGMQQNPR